MLFCLPFLVSLLTHIYFCNSSFEYYCACYLRFVSFISMVPRCLSDVGYHDSAYLGFCRFDSCASGYDDTLQVQEFLSSIHKGDVVLPGFCGSGEFNCLFRSCEFVDLQISCFLE